MVWYWTERGVWWKDSVVTTDDELDKKLDFSFFQSSCRYSISYLWCGNKRRKFPDTMTQSNNWTGVKARGENSQKRRPCSRRQSKSGWKQRWQPTNNVGLAVRIFAKFSERKPNLSGAGQTNPNGQQQNVRLKKGEVQAARALFIDHCLSRDSFKACK